jgi:hypothetical protein
MNYFTRLTSAKKQSSTTLAGKFLRWHDKETFTNAFKKTGCSYPSRLVFIPPIGPGKQIDILKSCGDEDANFSVEGKQ